MSTSAILPSPHISLKPSFLSHICYIPLLAFTLQPASNDISMSSSDTHRIPSTYFLEYPICTYQCLSLSSTATSLDGHAAACHRTCASWGRGELRVECAVLCDLALRRVVMVAEELMEVFALEGWMAIPGLWKGP